MNLKEKLFWILQHVETCGRGTCIFLEPSQNLIHIYSDKRAHAWDSVYLDVHGESNVELKYIIYLFFLVFEIVKLLGLNINTIYCRSSKKTFECNKTRYVGEHVAVQRLWRFLKALGYHNRLTPLFFSKTLEGIQNPMFY